MKEIWVMKTFIVYNLDTRLPVAVGEAIKAEWARFETADKIKISAENLVAEEIDSIRVWIRPAISSALVVSTKRIKL
jgi:hypothetical protein